MNRNSGDSLRSFLSRQKIVNPEISVWEVGLFCSLFTDRNSTCTCFQPLNWLSNKVSGMQILCSTSLVCPCWQRKRKLFFFFFGNGLRGEVAMYACCLGVAFQFSYFFSSQLARFFAQKTVMFDEQCRRLGTEPWARSGLKVLEIYADSCVSCQWVWGIQ